MMATTVDTASCSLSDSQRALRRVSAVLVAIILSLTACGSRSAAVSGGERPIVQQDAAAVEDATNATEPESDVDRSAEAGDGQDSPEAPADPAANATVLPDPASATGQGERGPETDALSSTPEPPSEEPTTALATPSGVATDPTPAVPASPTATADPSVSAVPDPTPTIEPTTVTTPTPSVTPIPTPTPTFEPGITPTATPQATPTPDAPRATPTPDATATPEGGVVVTVLGTASPRGPLVLDLAGASPADTVQWHPVRDGTGSRPEAGDQVVVEYVMHRADDGELVESTTIGAPLAIVIGADFVPDAFDAALLESKAGARFILGFPEGMEDLPFYFEPGPYTLLVDFVSIGEPN